MTTKSCPITIDGSGGDIHGEAERIRAEGPVARVELPGGVVVWAITDHELVKRLLTDARVSRDTYQHWPAWENGEGELARTWSLAMWVQDRNMITAYGAEHSRLRRLVAKAFTARRTMALRPRVEAIVAELLDRLAATDPSRPVDLRSEFAYPLPIQVISELLGIPAGMRAQLTSLIHVIFDTSVSVEEATENAHALYALAGDLVATKRDQPGDDLTSGLIAAREEGTSLTDRELIDTVLLMYTAGHETTVNLIDHAVVELLSHADQLALVRGGDVAWDDVIDETLRLQAPLTNIPMRYAVSDIDLGEVVIPKGDAMIVAFGAAGRDPLVHGDTAGTFDVRRATRREHLAFGHGVHRCIGAPLGRLEAAVALPALFETFPLLSLAKPAAELLPIESFISNGHREVPVFLG